MDWDGACAFAFCVHVALACCACALAQKTFVFRTVLCVCVSLCLCDKMAVEAKTLKTFLGEVEWEDRDEIFDAFVLKIFNDNGLKVEFVCCVQVSLLLRSLCIACRHSHT